jgi:hypothetical protein
MVLAMLFPLQPQIMNPVNHVSSFPFSVSCYRDKWTKYRLCRYLSLPCQPLWRERWPLHGRKLTCSYQFIRMYIPHKCECYIVPESIAADRSVFRSGKSHRNPDNCVEAFKACVHLSALRCVWSRTLLCMQTRTYTRTGFCWHSGWNSGVTRNSFRDSGFVALRKVPIISCNQAYYPRDIPHFSSL